MAPGAGLNGTVFETHIVQIDTTSLGQFEDGTLTNWLLPTSENPTMLLLQDAADLLRTSNTPVAFPTETVYGLGADATRSSAVKGIFEVKGRPSDNPLIVHVSDLSMLNDLLSSPSSSTSYEQAGEATAIPIPPIYLPLIQKFWPGPLTILLPNPSPNPLAQEVTAGLPAFGVRMPDSALAQTLIKLVGVPIAAPSANASTKPSCTTAEHVHTDLAGKIEMILDGGPCQVGVESTVVDGLCNPPAILRPGGVSIQEISACEGWENVAKGYKDEHSEETKEAPKAPGMRYKHYSPRAKVVLYEPVFKSYRNIVEPNKPFLESFQLKGVSGLEVWRILAAKGGKDEHPLYPQKLDRPFRIGIITTLRWRGWAGFDVPKWMNSAMILPDEHCPQTILKNVESMRKGDGLTVDQAELRIPIDGAEPDGAGDIESNLVADMWKIALGTGRNEIAHGLFAALRELDSQNVDVIYVEGLRDDHDIAAAIMNRLRKAATVIEKPDIAPR